MSMNIQCSKWTRSWSVSPKKRLLKVSKFQNEFMRSSFLPKYEPNIVKISALYCATLQGRNPYNFWFIFWEKPWLHKLILKFTEIYWNLHNLDATFQFKVPLYILCSYYITHILKERLLDLGIQCHIT